MGCTSSQEFYTPTTVKKDDNLKTTHMNVSFNEPTGKIGTCIDAHFHLPGAHYNQMKEGME